jgi:hypothetical protein
MLLFQWGTYDWGDGPTFEFEIARQFVLAGYDADQADDALWQLRLTIHYPLNERTDALGAGHHWCERPGDAAQFHRAVSGTAAFAFARDSNPIRIGLSLDETG